MSKHMDMAHAAAKLRDAEARFIPSNNHWTVRSFKERVTRAQGRDVLLNRAEPIVKGEMCEWKLKHIGLGIYELTIGKRSK